MNFLSLLGGGFTKTVRMIQRTTRNKQRRDNLHRLDWSFCHGISICALSFFGLGNRVSNTVSEEEKLEAKLEMLKLNSEHQYRMEKIQADRDIAVQSPNRIIQRTTRNQQRRSKKR